MTSLPEGNRPYFATVALLGLSFYEYSLRSNESEKKIDYDRSFELLGSETGIIYIPGISTISFYTGDISPNNQL